MTVIRFPIENSTGETTYASLDVRVKPKVSFMSTIRKFLVAGAGLITLVAATELGTDSKWYAYLIAGLAALGVYAVPNSKP